MVAIGPAANKAGVAPGEMAKAAPALAAACRSEIDSTVPAPPTMSGSARAIASIARSAAGVRNVTSTTRMPPRTNARARTGPIEASSIVTTGMTGDNFRKSSIAVTGISSSASHRKARIPQQILNLGNAHEVEIPVDRMLQDRCRDAKIDSVLVIHLRTHTVKYACSERIPAADTINDPPDRVRPRRTEPGARQKRARQIVVIHTSLDLYCCRDVPQLGKGLKRQISRGLKLLRGRYSLEAALQDQADIALFRKQQVRLIHQLAQVRSGITMPALP